MGLGLGFHPFFSLFPPPPPPISWTDFVPLTLHNAFTKWGNREIIREIVLLTFSTVCMNFLFPTSLSDIWCKTQAPHPSAFQAQGSCWPFAQGWILPLCRLSLPVQSQAQRDLDAQRRLGTGGCKLEQPRGCSTSHRELPTEPRALLESKAREHLRPYPTLRS